MKPKAGSETFDDKRCYIVIYIKKNQYEQIIQGIDRRMGSKKNGIRVPWHHHYFCHTLLFVGIRVWLTNLICC